MITITRQAADHIKKLTNNNVTDYYLNVGIKAGGCSGFEYTLDITDNCPDDYIKNNSEDIQVISDPKSFKYLDGCQIDFVEGMMKSGFVFMNPNSDHCCGCGKSFSPSDCKSCED